MTLGEAVRSIAGAAVSRGVTPGGVLAAGRGTAGEARGDIVPFGTTQSHPPGAGVPVSASTVYDIASLTKPVATLAVFLRLADAGRIALDTPARALLPELDAEGTEPITVAHLLGHTAGFPDHVRFYERLWAGERAGAADPRGALLRMAGATPLLDAPGTTARYSDVGYILLAALLERAGGRRLDELARTLVFEPLGMSSTFFVDLEAPPGRPTGAGLPIAPTEVCPRRGLVRGEVHDENAHAAGGIAGHAGLFSTAEDLVRFARAVLAALSGAPGILSPELLRRLVATPAAPGSSWRLGWDTPSATPGISHAGDLWPRDGFGHLGFTGTSLWLDPTGGRHAVLLTNRVHPSREGTGIRELRRDLMDAVIRHLA
jgi:serine-type D-Ala-D-Ala carboxypeptidase